MCDYNRLCVFYSMIVRRRSFNARWRIGTSLQWRKVFILSCFENEAHFVKIYRTFYSLLQQSLASECKASEWTNNTYFGFDMPIRSCTCHLVMCHFCIVLSCLCFLLISMIFWRSRSVRGKTARRWQKHCIDCQQWLRTHTVVKLMEKEN